MSLRMVLRQLTYTIVSIAVLSTTYLYLYPLWFGCAFPSTTHSATHGFRHTIARHAGHHPLPNDTTVAPFRLLVLADPQLEGDSSLPDPEDALLSRLSAHRSKLLQTPPNNFTEVVAEIVKELVLEDIPRSFQAARKTLDLFGNDYYLAHIYRTLHWWSFPTHVTVLGDLIGSQWVSDDEFEWRGWRYWNRVFAGSQKVPDDIMDSHKLDQEKWKTFYSLRSDAPEDWKHTIINAVGNHDIGYAGDISESRLERFERTFGLVNWDIHLAFPWELIPSSYLNTSGPVPSFHLVVLNSMLLDTPAFDESLQGKTYEYINGLISNRLDPVEKRNSTFTLLLTHVPLHKPEGVCVDAPFFDFWDFTDDNGAFKSGGLKEQNHLSDHASHSGILQSIFGMSGNNEAPAGGRGRNGLILTGHDHAGCDVVHYIERNFTHHDTESSDESDPIPDDRNAQKPWSWKSIRTKFFPPASSHPTNIDTEIVTSLREVTLRSMMGEFGGNAGLLSLWYDFDAQEWQYEIQMCPLGVQHVWWAIHVVDIVAILILLGWAVEGSIRFQSASSSPRKKALEGKIEGRQRVTANGSDGTMKVVGRQVERAKSETTGSSLRSDSRRRRKG